MSERKFLRGLGKPGMAAQLRETMSQVVRESTALVSILYLLLLEQSLLILSTP
jgi:hypothetical protein